MHEPVGTAIRGKPLSVLVRVRPGSAPVRKVTLHYSTSRDAAPFDVPMTATQRDVYVATVPAAHFARSSRLYYYVEAVDTGGEWAETEWQEVSVQAPEGEAAEAPPPEPVEPGEEKGSVLTSPAFIAGAVVLAGGGIIAAAVLRDSGGSGGADEEEEEPADCGTSDVAGFWGGPDPAVAPGFLLRTSGEGLFFPPDQETGERGVWSISDCVLTLVPETLDLYRGSGRISDDRRTVTINGIAYTREN
jgi:hypothetical protein